MRIHIVQKGDTLWKLANKYDVEHEQIEMANENLINPEMLMPGMKVKIPTGTVAVRKEKKEPITQQTKPNKKSVEQQTKAPIQPLKKPEMKQQEIKKPKAEMEMAPSKTIPTLKQQTSNQKASDYPPLPPKPPCAPCQNNTTAHSNQAPTAYGGQSQIAPWKQNGPSSNGFMPMNNAQTWNQTNPFEQQVNGGNINFQANPFAAQENMTHSTPTPQELGWSQQQNPFMIQANEGAFEQMNQNMHGQQMQQPQQNPLANGNEWSNHNGSEQMQQHQNNYQHHLMMQAQNNQQHHPMMQGGSNQQHHLMMQGGSNQQHHPMMQGGSNQQHHPMMQGGSNQQHHPMMQGGSNQQHHPMMQGGSNQQHHPMMQGENYQQYEMNRQGDHPAMTNFAEGQGQPQNPGFNQGLPPHPMAQQPIIQQQGERNQAPTFVTRSVPSCGPTDPIMYNEQGQMVPIQEYQPTQQLNAYEEEDSLD